VKESGLRQDAFRWGGGEVQDVQRQHNHIILGLKGEAGVETQHRGIGEYQRSSSTPKTNSIGG